MSFCWGLFFNARTGRPAWHLAKRDAARQQGSLTGRAISGKAVGALAFR